MLQITRVIVHEDGNRSDGFVLTLKNEKIYYKVENEEKEVTLADLYENENLKYLLNAGIFIGKEKNDVDYNKEIDCYYDFSFFEEDKYLSGFILSNRTIISKEVFPANELYEKNPELYKKLSNYNIYLK